MAQTISTVDAVAKDYELTEPFRFATVTLETLNYALVRIRTSAGTVGYGEASAYWDPTGETQEAVTGAVKLLAPYLLGKDALELAALLDLCEAVAPGALSARCAIDMALHDIAGQHFGVPVHVLLGGRSYPLRASMVLGLGKTEQLPTLLSSAQRSGYKLFKVKLGPDIQENLATVETVCSQLNKGSAWFGDANQAWGSAKSALRHLRSLQKYEPLWVEQPVSAGDWDSLETVTRLSPISIIADESMCTCDDARRMVVARAVDGFNIKLNKCGGLRAGQCIMAVARAFHLRTTLGSMIEGELGALANYHFGVSHRVDVTDLAAHWMIKNRVDVGLAVEAGNVVLRSEQAGLGYPDPGVFEASFR